jgi:hypothetical protein
MFPEHAAEGPEEDTRVNDMVTKIREAGALGGSEPGSPPIGYLVKSRIPPQCDIAPASANILCTTIRRKEGPAYFFVNVSSKGYAGTCTFQAPGKPFLFDPSTGEDHPLQREKVSSSLSLVSMTLGPLESLCVLFR